MILLHGAVKAVCMAWCDRSRQITVDYPVVLDLAWKALPATALELACGGRACNFCSLDGSIPSDISKLTGLTQL